jgi:ketosteroid isomerase-like protein
VGAPRDRVRGGRRTRTWSLDGGDRDGKAHRDFLSAWDEFRLEAEDYRELDPERVIVLFGRSGRRKTSGVALGQLRSEGASLFHVRDGKVIRLVFYADREYALADLGLSWEADSP